MKTEKCEAMKGLISEGEDLIKHTEKRPGFSTPRSSWRRRRSKHYEMAGYGSLRTLADKLGYTEVAQLIQETLDEEKNADTMLNKLALDHIDDDAIMYRSAA